MQPDKPVWFGWTMASIGCMYMCNNDTSSRCYSLSVNIISRVVSETSPEESFYVRNFDNLVQEKSLLELLASVVSVLQWQRNFFQIALGAFFLRRVEGPSFFSRGSLRSRFQYQFVRVGKLELMEANWKNRQSCGPSFTLWMETQMSRLKSRPNGRYVCRDFWFQTKIRIPTDTIWRPHWLATC